MKRFIVVIAATGYDRVTLSLVVSVGAATAKSARKKALTLAAPFAYGRVITDAAAFPVDDAGIDALDSCELHHYIAQTHDYYDEAEAAQWRCMSAAWRAVCFRGERVCTCTQTLYAEF